VFCIPLVCFLPLYLETPSSLLQSISPFISSASSLGAVSGGSWCRGDFHLNIFGYGDIQYPTPPRLARPNLSTVLFTGSLSLPCVSARSRSIRSGISWDRCALFPLTLARP